MFANLLFLKLFLKLILFERHKFCHISGSKKQPNFLSSAKGLILLFASPANIIVTGAQRRPSRFTYRAVHCTGMTSYGIKTQEYQNDTTAA